MVSILGIILLPVLVRLLNKLPVEPFVWLSIFAIGYKLICVLFMIPFVDKFKDRIKKLFPKKDFDFGLYIQSTSPKIIDATFSALQHDLVFLLKKVLKIVF